MIKIHLSRDKLLIILNLCNANKYGLFSNLISNEILFYYTTNRRVGFCEWFTVLLEFKYYSE